MTKSKSPEITYKYRLFDLLLKKYGTDYLKGKKIISEKIGMSYSTVNTDFGIKAENKRVIPRPRLILYAKHFGVKESYLYTPKSSLRKMQSV